MSSHKYEIIVIGGGHAGIEAALVCARRGIPTLFITMDIEKIGQMSCNPAIGGLGKSHLIKDLDALGGEMGKAIDASGIQFRMINKTKGPAVWSLRVQADPNEYKKYILDTVFSAQNLTLKQCEAESLIIENNTVKGIRTIFGEEIYSRSVILCNGTFLNGRIYIGFNEYQAGRAWEFPSNALANNLLNLGITDGRLKTGTPARLWGPSIDFSKYEIQEGDNNIEFFSGDTDDLQRNIQQINCYIGYTNEKVHDIIKKNLKRSPMYGKKIIEGIGPRYCPSIEDKILRFQDKSRHQIFFEPVTRDYMEVYPSGISTSLPLDAQIEFYRAIEGLENVEFIKPAYAIEYDFANPIYLWPSLKSKKYENLYLAGQINGTSGYEEAAVQGFIAGCNASNDILKMDPFLISRSESYIGVLISDLVNKGVDEPYRMFTSRAEHRLILRLDNADERLLNKGRDLGLISEKRWQRFIDDQTRKESLLKELKQTKIPSKNGISLYKYLKRPEIKISDIKEYISNYNAYSRKLLSSLEIFIKYEGYIAREMVKVESRKQYANIKIPEDIDYNSIPTLTKEAREKLNISRPYTLGDAGIIPGITPAAIDSLLIYIKAGKKQK